MSQQRGEQDENFVQTFGVGSYGGLDDRVKRRGRKQQLGFAQPKSKPKSKPRKSR